MAYTFSATTHLITFGNTASPWGPTRVSLVTGWFFPTTLTAGRKLFGSGTVAGVEIDTTTSSIRMRVDNATTDGEWTAPVGLALNAWTFVAVLFQSNSTTTQTFAVWSGTADVPPVAQTVTQAVAPSGNIVDPTGTFTIGNSAGGSVAFQGDIGSLVLCVDARSPSTGINIFNQSLNGAFTNLDAIYKAFIEPIWRGDIGQIMGYGRAKTGYSSANPYGVDRIISLDYTATWNMRLSAQNGYTNATSISGAALSTRRTPRPFQSTYDNAPRRGLRGGFVAMG